MKGFYIFSLYASYGLLFLAFVTGIIKYFRLTNQEKWYFFYGLFLFLIELTTNILIEFFGYKNTTFLYPIFIAGEFFILTSLFIKKLKFSDYWLIPTLFLSVGLLIINQFLEVANDYIKAASNITVMCLSGYTLLQEIKNNSKTNNFILVDAFIFMYYTVSVFIFVLQNQLASLSENTYFIILSTNNMLLIIFYASLLYTFLLLKKKSINPNINY